MTLWCLLTANEECMKKCKGKDNNGDCILKKDKLRDANDKTKLTRL